MNVEPPQRPKQQPPKIDLFVKRGPISKPGPGIPPPPPPEDHHNLLNIIKTHTKEVVVYVLIITALIMLCFYTTEFYGSIIIGLLIGIFFMNELTWILKHLQELIDEYGLLKTIILGGTFLAFLIEAPLIVLTACCVLLFRFFLLPES